VRARSTDAYRSWLLGELSLVGLLALATVLLALTGRLDGYELPEARLVLDTVVAMLAGFVAILAATRFRVEGRRMDLLLAVGFTVEAVATFAFGVAPNLGGHMLAPEEAWAGVVAHIVGAGLIAVSPFPQGRLNMRRLGLGLGTAAVTLTLLAIWAASRWLAPAGVLTTPDDAKAAELTAGFAALTALSLAAAIGYGLRFRRHGRDLDSWLALALTLVLFSNLHYVLTPALSNRFVLQGDFLRLLAFGVLLVGVWRAIGHAEFGRAVAEERARVARDIHDGLAQYLFAMSTSVSMLEGGAPLEEMLPRLKESSSSAQQEARFAVLALSSASGSAPFDAALRRYVDFLVADGALDVELEIDPTVPLAPDEQIEIFRIVQEGLANARRHADARRAWVSIAQRGSRRTVLVRDDGCGFDGNKSDAGQGLRNMRRRADSIDGGFALRSEPGRGTEIEVVLRAA
jgi:signal transduction histidine kinase